MPGTFYLNDRNGITLQFRSEGEVPVIVNSKPFRSEETDLLPFRQFFTSNGSSSGSSDMKAVGTLASPSEFYIKAIQDYDIYIKSVSFLISDAGATLDKFGNVTALTNGVKLSWFTKENGEYVIESGLKSNFEFVRLCGGMPAFGTAAGSFRANNISGTSEGFIPVLYVDKMFGLPWGFRLRKGSSDKLSFSVRDDTTGVDSFNIIGAGTRI